MGMMKSRNAPLWRGVAVFTCSTLSGAARSGLTPRATSRSIPVSWLKARRSLSAWRIAGAASARESSYTISTFAASPARKRSSKSSGTTITASSRPSRTRSS